VGIQRPEARISEAHVCLAGAVRAELEEKLAKAATTPNMADPNESCFKLDPHPGEPEAEDSPAGGERLGTEFLGDALIGLEGKLTDVSNMMEIGFENASATLVEAETRIEDRAAVASEWFVEKHAGLERRILIVERRLENRPGVSHPGRFVLASPRMPPPRNQSPLRGSI